MGTPETSKSDAEMFERFEQHVRQDGRYAPAAFEFLYQGLELATQTKYGAENRPKARHVTGQELCHALRLLAIERWGLLAREVLRQWNIKRTRDFGEMVYLMVDLGLMGRQDSDQRADFDDVYNFDAAFEQYAIELVEDSTDAE